MQNRIKKIRKESGLTQVEFGKKIGVKGNTITNYETGLRSPTEAVILSICREFNVSEEWLRNGTGDMFRSVSRDDEITAFVSDLLMEEPRSFRNRLISALAKMTAEEWTLLERKMKEVLGDEIEKNSEI